MMAEKLTSSELKSYYQSRVKRLGERVVEAVENVLGPDTMQRHRDFEDRVEKTLQNGARFVPRKRPSR